MIQKGLRKVAIGLFELGAVCLLVAPQLRGRGHRSRARVNSRVHICEWKFADVTSRIRNHEHKFADNRISSQTAGDLDREETNTATPAGDGAKSSVGAITHRWARPLMDPWTPLGVRSRTVRVSKSESKIERDKTLPEEETSIWGSRFSKLI